MVARNRFALCHCNSCKANHCRETSPIYDKARIGNREADVSRVGRESHGSSCPGDCLSRCGFCFF